MLEITQILERIEAGDNVATNQLLPIVYNELRRLAAVKLASEKPGQTLQATALVHEAYVRLLGSDGHVNWSSRGHFFGAAAQAMRRILIEAARRKAALKHGGDYERNELEEFMLGCRATHEEIIDLEEALTKLECMDAEAAQAFKLRFYSGLSLDEVSAAMSISRTTAFKHWSFARAWLKTRLEL